MGRGKKWINDTLDEYGSQLKQYTQWCGMTNRHMSKTNKPYSNVVVCENFRNYDYFISWAKEQKGWLCDDNGGRIYSIDKDIVGNGKIYDEDSCVFIPTMLNLFCKPTPTGLLPRGISISETSKYKANVKRFGVRYRSEPMNKIEDALLWYFTQRVEYLEELKLKYSETVDYRVFENLSEMLWCNNLNNTQRYSSDIVDIRKSVDKVVAAHA